MRQAPPVGVTCSGQGAWFGVQVLLAALAAGVFVFWITRHVAGSAAAAGVAAAAAAATLRPRAARLQWDGQAWHADGEPGEVAVMLDLGGWLLLRWRAGRAVRWIAATRTEAGPAWHGLRVALYAS